MVATGNTLVYIVDVATLQIVKSVDVGGGPRRIAFSQQGHIAAVTNTAGFITFVR